MFQNIRMQDRRHFLPRQHIQKDNKWTRDLSDSSSMDVAADHTTSSHPPFPRVFSDKKHIFSREEAELRTKDEA